MSSTGKRSARGRSPARTPKAKAAPGSGRSASRSKSRATGGRASSRGRSASKPRATNGASTTTPRRSASRGASAKKGRGSGSVSDAGSAPAPPRAPHFRRNLLLFATIVLSGFASIYLFFSYALPSLESSDACAGVDEWVLWRALRAKDSTERATIVKGLAECASAYRTEYPAHVVAAFTLVYVMLQAFAIPGPIILSVIAGALYDLLPAQLLIAACATTGASLCFMLSYFLGNDIMQMLMPGPLAGFRAKIAANKDNMWYYLFFLRITPMLPNWFVNVASPVVGVPYYKFGLATLIGLMPANYFHVQTGRLLSTVTELSLSNADVLVKLFLLQFVALLPTLFKKKIADYDAKKFAADAAGGGGEGKGMAKGKGKYR